MNMDKILHSTVFRFILALWRRENPKREEKAGKKMQSPVSLGGFLASNNPNPPRVSAALPQSFIFIARYCYRKSVWWIATLLSRPSRHVGKDFEWN